MTDPSEFTKMFSNLFDVYVDPNGCINITSTDPYGGDNINHICESMWKEFVQSVDELLVKRSNDPESPYCQ